MRSLLTTLALAALCSFGAAACDDEDEQNDCKLIQEACHARDPGSGPIHECHENAEGKWTQAQCTSNKAMCLSLCTAADGGS
jgi:hypothetical protein